LTLDAAVAALGASYGGVKNWSSGASINLVSVPQGRMANVEVHQGRQSTHEVPAGAN